MYLLIVLSAIILYWDKWNEILVIGRTIERENNKYHIFGITIDEEAKLYIIEPYREIEEQKPRRKQNQRTMLRMQHGEEACYQNCRKIYFGNKKLLVFGASSTCLKYTEYEIIFDLMDAGWNVPEWLKYEDWGQLQLVTLELESMNKLPKYTLDMLIVIKHQPMSKKHILKKTKTVTLRTGKKSAFSFMDSYGDRVQCYINDVALIGVWKDTQDRFDDSRYREHLTQEQIEQMKTSCLEVLEKNCPKGKYFIEFEYECSKEINLQLYTKEYLNSNPESNNGSSTSLIMMTKSDKKLGTHSLPLMSSVLQTPVQAEVKEVKVELVYYMEKVNAWEEVINL